MEGRTNKWRAALINVQARTINVQGRTDQCRAADQWRAVLINGGPYRAMEGRTEQWRAVLINGGPYRAMEGPY